MESTASIPGGLVHTEHALSRAAGGAGVCSAARPALLPLPCVTGLLICRLQRAAELVPASSTRRSDGSSVLAPVFCALRLARPQGSAQDASLHCPLSSRGAWRCRKYEPGIEGRRNLKWPKTM